MRVAFVICLTDLCGMVTSGGETLYLQYHCLARRKLRAYISLLLDFHPPIVFHLYINRVQLQTDLQSVTKTEHCHANGTP